MLPIDDVQVSIRAWWKGKGWTAPEEWQGRRWKRRNLELMHWSIGVAVAVVGWLLLLLDAGVDVDRWVVCGGMGLLIHVVVIVVVFVCCCTVVVVVVAAAASVVVPLKFCSLGISKRLRNILRRVTVNWSVLAVGHVGAHVAHHPVVIIYLADCWQISVLTVVVWFLRKGSHAALISWKLFLSLPVCIHNAKHFLWAIALLTQGLIQALKVPVAVLWQFFLLFPLTEANRWGRSMMVVMMMMLLRSHMIRVVWRCPRKAFCFFILQRARMWVRM